MIITCIVAVDMNWGIGYKGQLPWPKIKRDMKHFRDYTMGKAVLMGANTYYSVGPLAGRAMFVVRRNKTRDTRVYTVRIIDEAIELLDSNIHELVVMGGEYVYNQAADKCDRLILTQIASAYPADKFLPESLRATEPKYMHNWQLESATYYKGEQNTPAMTIAAFNRIRTSCEH